jgi:hypothetical protein
MKCKKTGKVVGKEVGRPFRSVSLPLFVFRELSAVAELENRSVPKMVAELIKNWERTHCPECGTQLNVGVCRCKMTERM